MAVTEQNICPHTEGIPDGTDIPGFREGWLERLVANFPDNKIAQQGFLSVLYQLEAESQPPAFERPISVAKFQRAIRLAISTIREKDIECIMRRQTADR